MATAEKLPFSWRAVESLPDLERLRLVLDTLPDEEIVAALEAGRGRGRNDDPVRSMWRALIAGVVFQHASIQSLLRELDRNPALLEICGFEALPVQSAPVTGLRKGNEGPSVVTHPARLRSTVPGHWNFSRFLTCVVRLEKERGLVSAMVESLRASLFEEVPDFGRHLGYDGKAIESHSTGRVAEAKMKARVGLALTVMMALALGRVRAGNAERMRSLVGAPPRHRLTVCPTSGIVARPSHLRSEGKPRPAVSSCSRSVPISRQTPVFCSPGGDQTVDIRPPKISIELPKNATTHRPQLDVALPPP